MSSETQKFKKQNLRGKKVQFVFVLVDKSHITADGGAASDQDAGKRVCAHVRLTPPPPISSQHTQTISRQRPQVINSKQTGLGGIPAVPVRPTGLLIIFFHFDT